MPSILTYHKIGRQFEIGISSISGERFRGQLELLLGLRRPWSRASDAVLEAASDGDPIVITFDDGYESVYTEAFPVMSERGISGTVFPVVGAIGGYNAWDVRLSVKRFRHLSWPQIEELARYGFEIGSHTLSHRGLTLLGRERLAAEMGDSRKRLEDRLGRGVTAIAYPFGMVNERVVDAAEEAGYKCGFASSPAMGLGKHDGTGRMNVGRMSIHVMDSNSSLLRKAGARPGYRLEAAENTVIAWLSRCATLVKR